MIDAAPARWSFWVDRGGTFTDVVARTPSGDMRIAKLLSVDPERYDDAAVAAIRRLTDTPTGALPPLDIRVGTTIATNALLERAGEPVLLAITRGFSRRADHRHAGPARHLCAPDRATAAAVRRGDRDRRARDI